MTFVNPSFLWALLAVSAPIIIHLFNYRKYKKVYFSNVRFLKNLQQESKSKSRLKEILVLLARCLALACLVLAFSQPILIDNKVQQNSQGVKHIGVYIDNSFSMQNLSKQGALIELAKNKAKEIIMAFGSEDKFQVLSNDFEGRHQRLYSRDEALELIQEIKVSSAVKAFSKVLNRQREFLQQGSDASKRIYSISDLQKSSFDIQNLENDSLFVHTILPLASNQINNVYIDTCWFETPLQQKGFIQKLHAVVQNKGTGDLEAGSAKLFINQTQVGLASFSVAANSKQELKFTFECKESGFNFGSIKIEDYPITFDDELFFAFNSRLHVGVYLVNGSNLRGDNGFESLFEKDSLFKYKATTETTINYSEFRTTDVIVLNQLKELSTGLVSELIKFSKQGGAVILVPSADLNITNYNIAFSALGIPMITETDTVLQEVGQLNLESDFYNGVFEKIDDRLNLPKINYHYRLKAGGRFDFESVLKFQNNDEFVVQSKLNNGKLFLLTAPLESGAGNFNKHALFVPTIYKMCFKSINPQSLYYPVHNNVLIQLKNDVNKQEEPPHIKQMNGDVDVIPQSKLLNNGLNLYTQSQIKQPGFYIVSRGEEKLHPLAFNYSRIESDLNCYSVDELKELLEKEQLTNIEVVSALDENFSEQILRGAAGKELWKLFIILALVFIVVELLLLRILK